MRDLAPNIAPVQVVEPVVLTGNRTSAAIDLLDFRSVAFVVSTGAIAGSGSFSMTLQESDTTAGGDFADVPADRLSGSLDTPFEADTTQKIGYVGHKRFVRAVISKASGTSIAVAVTAVKGHPAEAPV